MKKMMIALVAMLTIAATGKAMSYEQARNEALFLTDKMAYELNLTEEQYEAAYEINLDYLMGVTSYDDVFGTYWEHRNLDMSYILFDWQWEAFCAATYFYRPLYWEGGYWHFGIYARYPHRDYFYFGRPLFYASYRGGHAWHVVGGHGYYHGHRDHFHPSGRTHFGMLDRWNRGDFRGNHSNGHSRGHFGGSRNSSTRTTVNHNRDFGRDGHHEGMHDNGRPSSGGNTHNSSSGSFSRPSSSSRPTMSNRNGSMNNSHSSTMTNRSSSSGSRSHSSGSFSGAGSRNSGSFSSGGSRSSGSFSSGSTTRSSGGGSHSGGHSGGGRSFGGHR